MKFRNPNRSTRESVILVIVFIGIFVFMLNAYTKERKLGRERSLQYELTILRQGVNLYTYIEKHRPKNLMDLATNTFCLPGDEQDRKFVEQVRVNRNGEIVDPFGNVYAYDEETGWVRSTTPAYRHW